MVFRCAFNEQHAPSFAACATESRPALDADNGYRRGKLAPIRERDDLYRVARGNERS